MSNTMPSEAWDDTHPDHLEWVAENRGICPINCPDHRRIRNDLEGNQ